MGKFFNGQTKGNRGSLIRYIIIGCGIFFIILLFILIAAKANKKDNVVLEPKESITIEINSELPETKDLFDKIENYDVSLIEVDYGYLDVTEVGEYEVTVSAGKYGTAEVTVIVADRTVPELILKDVEIEYGDYYSIDDFVESCVDNSGDECDIEYYESTDQSGKYIDYSSFTDPGTYIVKIVASDYSDNVTPVKEAKLTITGEGTITPPVEGNCLFGNMVIDKTVHNYPIAVIVGDVATGCALDRNIWDDDNISEQLEKFIKDDQELLKHQEDVEAVLHDYYPNGARIKAYPENIVIFNQEVKGLVGFAIHVKVYIVDQSYDGIINKDENLAFEYYINSDHSRSYIFNKYNIK